MWRANIILATAEELAEWGRKHPGVLKVSVGTVNKQLGAVQAMAGWAHHNGVIPDDVPWATALVYRKQSILA